MSSVVSMANAANMFGNGLKNQLITSLEELTNTINSLNPSPEIINALQNFKNDLSPYIK